jgi:hypothetical protein
MSDESISVVHFQQPGPQNTERTLEVALDRARALELGHVVVASDTGKSARAALAHFGADFEVVVVTNPRGLKLPLVKLHNYTPQFAAHKRKLREQGVQAVSCSLSDEVVAELEQAGARVTRIDWRRFQTFTKSNLQTLDWISVGVRVGLVIAVWGVVTEAIPPDCEVLTLSGTGFGGGGLDTATIVQTAPRFRDFRVCEILARPRIGPPSET